MACPHRRHLPWQRCRHPTSTIPRRSSIGLASAMAALATLASRARMAVRSESASSTVAVGVADDEVHPKVGRELLGPERVGPHGDAGDVAQRRRQRVDQPTPRWSEPVGGGGRRLGGRDQRRGARPSAASARGQPTSSRR